MLGLVLHNVPHQDLGFVSPYWLSRDFAAFNSGKREVKQICMIAHAGVLTKKLET